VPEAAALQQGLLLVMPLKRLFQIKSLTIKGTGAGLPVAHN
jgi:hypothetical protein